MENVLPSGYSQAVTTTDVTQLLTFILVSGPYVQSDTNRALICCFRPSTELSAYVPAYQQKSEHAPETNPILKPKASTSSSAGDRRFDL